MAQDYSSNPMSKKRNQYCAHCGSPDIRVVSIKTATELLEVSQDFIRRHIEAGTISTIALRSPSAESGRMLVRIKLDELLKLIEERPGVNELVENALSNS